MHKKTNGLLTIIIPCYNAEKYLHRCFLSLESLSTRDISILFVNDGSKDLSLQLLEAWIEKHPNAYIISKENGGYATAVNAGLDCCGSEYVMFMGVDDELVQNGMEQICHTLRKRQPDILAFTTVKHYDDMSPSDVCSEVDSVTQYVHEGEYQTDIFDLFRVVGNDAWILFTRDTSRCFKMSLIGELRYIGKTGVSADGCFAGLVACRAKKFIFMNAVCYLWHVHKDSVSGSGRKKTLEKLTEEAEVWKMFFSQIRKEFVSVPDPIVNHYFVYMALIGKLREAGMSELACKHEIEATEFSQWARKNACITPKSRCKLMLPKVYCLMSEIKNKSH